MSDSILGLDVGGTKTAIVEGTFEGRILSRRELPTQPADAFSQTFRRMNRLIDEAIAEAAASGRAISAISVSIGGPLRIATGKILDPPHLPGWHGIDLLAELNAKYPEWPAFVEHDGNAGALAEFHFGSGRTRPGVRHLIFLTFGTGLGAGIIVNGDILHGASDTAGEVGHWRLSEDGPVGFGKAGSWEGWASGKGMLGIARAKNPDRWQQASLRDLVGDMLADDPEALSVAAESAHWLGRGIALLLDAFNPDIVALGALSAVLGERIFVPLNEELAREALPQAVQACSVIPAELGSGIGDVASLMAAITRMNPR
jgi:glucokinase